MNNTYHIDQLQREAIVREYVHALNTGNNALAQKIKKANEQFIPTILWAELVKKEIGN